MSCGSVNLLFQPYNYQGREGDGKGSLEEKKQGSFFWTAVHTVKKGFAFAGNCTSSTGDYASYLRHIPNQLAPFIELLSKLTPGALSVFLAPIVGYVALSDLAEPINDIQYFFGGGLLKDLAKRCYASVAAHIALVPTNQLTWIWFLKDARVASFSFLGKAANAIGNARVFSWAPDVAQNIQHLPILRAIPNLTGFAQWLGNARVFSFVTSFAVGPACFTTLCLAYVFFSIQYYQKWNKYTAGLAEAKERFTIAKTAVDKSLNEVGNYEACIKKIEQKRESILNKKREKVRLEDLEEKEEEGAKERVHAERIGKLGSKIQKLENKLNPLLSKVKTARTWEIKQLHREHKLSAARWGFGGCISKLVLNGVILGGMTKIVVLSSIAASVPAMAVLGLVAMTFVGAGIYSQWNYKKPSIEMVS